MFLPNRRPPRPARAGKRPRLCRAAPCFRPPAPVFPAFLPANRPRKVWNRPGSPAATQIWPHVGPGCPPCPFPRLLQKPRRCRHVAPLRPQRSRLSPGLRRLPPFPGQPAHRVPRRPPLRVCRVAPVPPARAPGYRPALRPDPRPGTLSRFARRKSVPREGGSNLWERYAGDRAPLSREFSRNSGVGVSGPKRKNQPSFSGGCCYFREL